LASLLRGHFIRKHPDYVPTWCAQAQTIQVNPNLKYVPKGSGNMFADLHKRLSLARSDWLIYVKVIMNSKTPPA
jgi:hypothetical protein